MKKKTKITDLPNGGRLYEYWNGDKEWYLNGKFHREGAPAREWSDGYKEWWLNGHHHREDGPARDYPNGNKEWWINGIHIPCTSQDQFLRLIKLKGFW